MNKSRIIEGAEQLFFRAGIKSVTMDDIAQHLGMSKKTIYTIFRDKDDIVNALMDIKLSQDRQEISEICSKSGNIVEEVFAIMKYIATMFSKLNPVIFYDLQKYHPVAWKKFKAFKEEFILSTIENTILNGIRQGYVRQDVNVKVIAKMRVEQIELAFNPQVFPPDKFNIGEVQVIIMEHFLYGICTLKGHKLINKFKEIDEED